MPLLVVYIAALLASSLAQVLIAPCPDLISPGVPFSLPTFDPETGYAPALAYKYQVIEGSTGLELTDVNGDSLADLVYSYLDGQSGPNHFWQCVYLNNQCGWVIAANYTGPVNTCLPVSSVVARGVVFPWLPSTTVGMLVDDVRAELSVAGDIWVEQAATGLRFARSALVETAARDVAGFSLHIEKERIAFRR